MNKIVKMIEDVKVESVNLEEVIEKINSDIAIMSTKLDVKIVSGNIMSHLMFLMDIKNANKEIQNFYDTNKNKEVAEFKKDIVILVDELNKLTSKKKDNKTKDIEKVIGGNKFKETMDIAFKEISKDIENPEVLNNKEFKEFMNNLVKKMLTKNDFEINNYKKEIEDIICKLTKKYENKAVDTDKTVNENKAVDTNNIKPVEDKVEDNLKPVFRGINIDKINQAAKEMEENINNHNKEIVTQVLDNNDIAETEEEKQERMKRKERREAIASKETPVCNLCNDPACTRIVGEKHANCIHYNDNSSVKINKGGNKNAK